MRYSLLSRFQGALLGGAIGDALTGQKNLPERSRAIEQPDWYNILHYQPSEWTDKLKQVCLMINESNQLELQFEQQGFGNSGEWAYIALPIVLFYHENNSLLQQEIRRFAQYWHWSAEVLENVLLWSYIVALVLREKWDTQNIIGQVLGHVGEEPTILFQLLTQLESWLSEGRSLEQVVAQLSGQTSDYSIPLSLYCFSSTPEEFYLSVSRAASYQTQARMTARLTGALAGGYNGVMSIPMTWRKLSAQNSWYQDIAQQGTILLDNWSGVYQGEQKLAKGKIKQKVIAASGTIQTRSSLTVISQQE